MFSTLLIILGSVLVLFTVLIGMVFLIAGGFRRSSVNTKMFVASGITGVGMLGLGVAGMIYGAFLLRIAFLILSPALFLGLAILCVRAFEGVKLREYIKREHVNPVLRFLVRIGAITGTIMISDVLGLWIFLTSQGLWNLLGFIELLIILLISEGTLIGAGGAFVFYGFSEYRLMRQAALWPTLARDQVEKWSERRVSQQKWGFAMLITGFLLIFLGLLTSFLTSV